MSEIGDRAYAFAETKIGDAYVLGNNFGLNGGDKNSGDCSGLTQWAWHAASGGSIYLVHHAYTQFHDVHRVCTGSCFASAIKGDLVFFAVGNDCPPNCPGHVAMAEGDGVHVISATNPSTGVEYRNILTDSLGPVMGIGRPAGGPGGDQGCGSGGIVQAATFALAQGLDHDQAIIAVAIAGAESGYNLKAENPPCCYGPWQIDVLVHTEYTIAYVETWVGAATAMDAISSHGTDWTPWSTYGSGAYLDHIDEATVVVECLIAGGGGGGGGQTGVPIPLPLSRKFDRPHWFRNMGAIESWSYLVGGQFKIAPLPLGTHRSFEEGQYRYVIREVQGYVDALAFAAQVPMIQLRKPFDETNYRRNMGMLTDFADTLGASGPPPPGGGGGGGGGPIFGIDRMANQTHPPSVYPDFIVCRRSMGLSHDSDTYAADVLAEATADGKLTLFYHYTLHGGTAEADVFTDAVGRTVGAGNEKHYGMAIDWEEHAATLTSVQAFMDRVRANTGGKCGLYTFWYFLPGGFPYLIGQDWDWVSYVVHPNRPPPGSYDIWQYDVVNAIDRDRADLSRADLAARVSV